MTTRMQTHYYTGGRNWLISELLAIPNTTFAVEAWGNTREGFTPYIVSLDTFGKGSGVSIGPTYRTLNGLRLDVQRAYGNNVKVKQGRNW